MATLNATRWPLPQRHSFSLVPFRELNPGNSLGQHRYIPTSMAPLSRKAFTRLHGKVAGTATTMTATHTAQHAVPERTSSTRTIPVANVCYIGGLDIRWLLTCYQPQPEAGPSQAISRRDIRVSVPEDTPYPGPVHNLRDLRCIRTLGRHLL